MAWYESVLGTSAFITVAYSSYSSLCKIRKVRCSGNQPCNRCEELKGECVYDEPSDPDTQYLSPL
jgi:hypothetical protein